MKRSMPHSNRHSESSPEVFCESIRTLSPEERYERLKELNCNDLFFEVMKLLPQVWYEFLWFDKREELESTLVHVVSPESIQRLIERGTEGMGPTSLASLVEQWSEEDEFWLFDAIPGDKGYALVRDGRIVEFSVVEVRCF